MTDLTKLRRRRKHINCRHHYFFRLSYGASSSIVISIAVFFTSWTIQYEYNNHVRLPLVGHIFSLGTCSIANAEGTISTVSEQTKSTTVHEAKTPYHIKFENPNYRRGHKTLSPYILSNNMTVGTLIHPKELMDEEVFQAYSSITEFFEGGKDETRVTKNQDSSQPSNDNEAEEGEVTPKIDEHNSEHGSSIDTSEERTKIENALKLLHGQNPNMATMTLRGYKGGPMANQINQDRAVLISPYIWWSNDDDIEETINKNPQEGGEEEDEDIFDEVDKKHESKLPPEGHEKDFLLGVFDGHGTGGEVVSEFVAVNLPKLLAYKIREYQNQWMVPKQSDSEDEAFSHINKSDTSSDTSIAFEVISTMLHETFLELDETSPPSESLSGGCTASVAFKFGSYLFVANAGDSRIIVGYSKNIPETERETEGAPEQEERTHIHTIQYVTREDKPHLEEERRRVESLHGDVYIPKDPKGTSRVMRTNRATGQKYGLAMSRSIGDWGVGQYGVIPDPLIEVIDLSRMRWEDGSSPPSGCAPTTGDDETEQDASCSNINDNPQDLERNKAFFFVVGATDGLFDFVTPENVVDAVGDMFSTTKTENIQYSEWDEAKQERQHKQSSAKRLHPITTCGYLVGEAVHGWNAKHGGRYRDDIAIAIHKVII